MKTQQRKRYSSDLNDRQWKILAPHIPMARSNRIIGGAPETYTKREVINGILYVKTNGCKWGDLPHDLPPSGIVYHYFNTWSKDGTWEHVNTVLCRSVRKRHARKPEPTVAIIDARSVKNSEIPDISGYDAGKKVKGIKQHIAVDTLGLLLAVIVHPADIQDRDGAKFVLKKLKKIAKHLKKIFADQGYAGKLVGWTRKTCCWVLEVVKRTGTGFVVLPKRWIVERTFSWFCKSRRLAINYEQTARNAEAMVYVCMIHLMVQRLARAV